VRSDPPGSPERFQWLAAACADATILVDQARLDELAQRMESEARAYGAVLPLTLALSHAGLSYLIAGYLAEAERCLLEHAAIAEARGRRWDIGALLMAAWRGQSRPVPGLLEAVAGEAGREGQGYQLVFADYARCVIELGQGRYDAAYASFTTVVEDSSQIKFVLPDLVEAAQRSGHPAAAERIVAQLDRLAAASPSPLTLGNGLAARPGGAALPQEVVELLVPGPGELHGRDRAAPGWPVQPPGQAEVNGPAVVVHPHERARPQLALHGRGVDLDAGHWGPVHLTLLADDDELAVGQGHRTRLLAPGDQGPAGLIRDQGAVVLGEQRFGHGLHRARAT
jgi:hypothetical protein